MDGESGRMFDSVIVEVISSGEDSSSSMRRPIWYEMNIEYEQESENNSYF